MLLKYSAANTRQWRVSRFRGMRATAWVAAGIIAAMVLAAFLAPVLAPYDPEAIDLSNVNGAASAAHWLGTDSSGRDVLSRLLYGARLSLLGPLVVVLISLLIGVPAGLWAGYKGGWVDTIISRAVDLILAFPPLLLAIVVVATFGANFLVAAIALSITYVPLVARVVRGSVIAESTKDHVQAAKVLGYSDTRIMGIHLFPNVAGVVVAQSTLNFGYALLDLAGLAFLGLGTQPPTADWGQMLSDGRENILYSGFQVAAASIVISVAVLSFNVLGDALSDRFARK